MQEVKYIYIEDLVLWTENPRDPIEASATDQHIVDKAIADKSKKWDLPKLAKNMGERYDFSELPTVVYHGSKPVVYDGNRRVVLGKIKHGLVKVSTNLISKIPDFPDKLPCNVCSKDIALENIYRKHSDSGSWDPLERDIFLYKFMGKEKSDFLILEEETGIVTQNPHLNKGFVKKEIFKKEILNRLGFFVEQGKLYSIHSPEEGYEILSDISEKIKNEDISTRKYRGKVLEVLEAKSQELIDKNRENKIQLLNVKFSDSQYANQDRVKAETPNSRQSKRIKAKKASLFGEKLYLKIGEVSNLYRDISDLYDFYLKNKKELSDDFPSLIRMSLRLLCETAAKNSNKKLDNYIKDNFTKAKSFLNQDQKTTLSNQNVTENSIIQLLHTGAHGYNSTKNIEQTIAISIIIGKILSITYGKEE